MDPKWIPNYMYPKLSTLLLNVETYILLFCTAVSFFFSEEEVKDNRLFACITWLPRLLQTRRQDNRQVCQRHTVPLIMLGVFTAGTAALSITELIETSICLSEHKATIGTNLENYEYCVFQGLNILFLLIQVNTLQQIS